MSIIVGDRKAQANCLGVNQVAQTIPADTHLGTAKKQTLVSLNCDDDAASAKTPGFSAASPQGQPAAKANKSS